jgi:thioredoxin reductase
METEVVIIGAGPAGAAAAIQLSRSAADFILLEKKSAGGLLNSAFIVENFPGFPDGISGGRLAGLLSNHLKKWNINPLFEEVLSVEFRDNHFAVETKSKLIKSKYLIAASGTKARPVPYRIPKEIGHRVHSEISPLLGVSGLNIAVVGGGDAAFDYALNLSVQNKVYILCRSSPRCLPLLYSRARDCEKINVLEDVRIISLRKANQRSTDDVTAISIDYEREGKNYDLSVDRVLFAIGREPEIDYLKMDPNEIKTLQRKGRLFMCGDVKNGRARQAVIAAGDGLKAAMHIILNRVQS